MVKLNRIPKEMGLECDIYVKCDYLNPSGSTNDRLALAMFNSIEKSGNLKPGWTLIAPTCGSTAISLAMISTIRSYKLISVLPESTSPEINITLHALGAQTVHATPESAQKVAHRLHQEIKDSVVLDEHRNQEDSYESLVKEILKTMDGSLDMFVAQTEVASGMNPKIKDCTSVGVTPTGPVLADPLTKAHVASVTLIQIQTNDKDAFEMARKLIKDEGILCGGLSGANVWAACQMAKGLPRETKLVVLLPDSVTNYMSSFLDDDWMKKRGYVV
ncbi:hypothetical protein L596_027163 [Steinernema carpocapsae]|uniref:Tryptophan synthase beta chain-like PALP domain-containing protein n=1 Tax=Steinernema carpocapsae TaxID=34508 RepID=A0A4U5M3J6_STECR|nr:hypothetical protein L596_027163 [Steinernema carpocapsae]